jgi:tetratricopeptide (TPR) repeat protein
MNKLIWLLCCIAFTANAQKNSLRELINRKQFEEVLSQTKLLTSSDSTHAETMYSIGEAYEGLLKYKDAFRTYKICYALDSVNTDFLYAMARTATNLGKVSEAKSSYGKILAMDSTNFYASYQLARLHYQLDEFKDAMQIYSRLLDKDPDNSALWRSMGDCYTRTRQNEIAALSYFKAYSLNRENGSLANTLINTLLRLGGKDAADALAICDTALFYNPGNIQLRQSKGMALYTNK